MVDTAALEAVAKSVRVRVSLWVLIILFIICKILKEVLYMSMTKSRRSVYNKSWYKRECKFDMKRRKREYNRKIRHQKLSEDSCSRGYNQKFRHLEWNTLT